MIRAAKKIKMETLNATWAIAGMMSLTPIGPDNKVP